jgi:hypothetical protein
MLRYILNVLIAADQLVNTLIGGYPDETISAAAWRGEQSGRIAGKIMRPVIDFLFLPFERHHCFGAWLSEFNHTQRP